MIKYLSVVKQSESSCVQQDLLLRVNVSMFCQKTNIMGYLNLLKSPSNFWYLCEYGILNAP